MSDAIHLIEAMECQCVKHHIRSNLPKTRWFHYVFGHEEYVAYTSYQCNRCKKLEELSEET